MNEAQIEERIRAAFAEDTFSRPASAIVHEARFRRGRLALSSVAVALLVSVAVVALPRGTQPAYGWTPAPQEPSAEAEAAVKEACDRSSGDLPPRVAVDQRGDAAMGFYADDSLEVTCFVRAEDGDWSRANSTSGSVGAQPDEVDRLSVGTRHEWPGWEDDKGVHSEISAITGAAPQEARKVEVTLDNAMILEASLGSGLYIAWWPFDATPTEIVATNSAGDTIATCYYDERYGPDCDS